MKIEKAIEDLKIIYTREPSGRAAFGLTKSSECCIMLRKCERRK
jgi:hypothetical protein